MTNNKQYIYESPDKGKTIYRREFGSLERQLYRTSESVSQPEKGEGKGQTQPSESLL